MLLCVAASLTLVQGQMYFRSAGTESAEELLSQIAQVQSALQNAEADRKKRDEEAGKRNSAASVLAGKSAPIIVKGKIVADGAGGLKRVDQASRYRATVKLDLLNEKQSAMPGVGLMAQTLSADSLSNLYAFLGNESDASDVVTTDANGSISLTDVSVPSALSVKLADDPSASDLRFDAGETVIPVAKPTADQIRTAKPIGKASPPKIVGFETINRKKVKIWRVDREYLIEIKKSIEVRREVAEFIIPKPSLASSGAIVKVFLGDAGDKSKGLPLEEVDQNWRVRVQRGALSGPGKFIVRCEQRGFSFGGEATFEDPDCYRLNRANFPALKLESVAQGAVNVLGKPVSDSYPISPFHWTRSGASGGSGTVELVTGKKALEVLGLAESKDKKVFERKYKKPDFGEWLVFPQQGIWLHTRFEPNASVAGQLKDNMKFLPGLDQHGLLESVRFTKSEAGSVGDVFRVGASKADIVAFMGEPDKDPADIAQRLKLGEGATRSEKLYGDKTIECWDDTFLHGGIRVKWANGQVAWFEIARPVQLLFDGTRAFVPGTAPTVYLESVEGTASDRDRVEAMCSSFLKTGSGVRAVNDPSAADFRVRVRFSIASEKTHERHQYYRKYRDSKGKERGEYRDEGFECEQAFGRANFAFDLIGRDGNKIDGVVWTNTSAATSQSSHSEHKVCRASELAAREDSLYGQEAKLRRLVGDMCTRASDMTGAVLAVNYVSGEMLINLGAQQGVQGSGNSEVTEMDAFIVDEVNPNTGATMADLEPHRVVGKNFKEWIEVLQVGPNWCIAKPVKKDGIGHTILSHAALIRLVDPASGLLRVKLSPKIKK